MTAILDPVEYPVRLSLDPNKKILSWSGDWSRLGVESENAHESSSFENIFCVLSPGASLAKLVAGDPAPILVGFARSSGVPLALHLRLEATDEGFVVHLKACAEPGATAEEDTIRARLHAMLNWAPGFCYTVDTNLTFTSSRGAGLSNIHLEDNQLVGMSLMDLWQTKDLGYEPLQCHLRAFGGMTQTYRDVCVGRSLHYEISPLRDEAGAIVGAVGVGIDVTERETSQDEKARLLSQLRQAQKMESVGQLAGGIAHDFNNLLTCIIGNVALARELGDPESKTAKMLEGAATAADSAAALTRQLLAYSRKQVIDPRPLSLNTLTGRVEMMLRRMIGENISLSLERADDLWFVRADPGQLEQIIVNLVVNARDATRENGRIVISTCNKVVEKGAPVGELPPGEYVRLSVVDNGEGISEGVQAKLFEPFFTTKPLGEGTGLGLATVYGAVQQNGGEVVVESTLGEGAAFHIYLPRVMTVPQLVEEVQQPPSETRAKGGSETILLVEDELSVLELSQRALENLGYRVLACASADDALRVFEEERGHVEILVTDVVMPNMNGKELASRITGLDPEVAVLFTSGYGENIIAINGVIERDIQFLPKPYRPAQLAWKVRDVLDKVARDRMASVSGRAG
jgi:signal transduction histidine kinase/ActR/RegA family two-component response regulator